MQSIIHINDSNLLIQQGQQLSQSRGFAWLKDGHVYFDFDPKHSAVKHCRIAPQQINSRYWQQCAQSAIATNQSGMRHAADLIWSHLTQLKQAYDLDEVVLVVPSHYQTANLDLLVGIAQACDIQVMALYDKAVLAVSGKAQQPGTYVHLDIQLHQTVCSTLSQSNGQLKLEGVDILHEVGQQAMQDALLKAIQTNFIQNDRFDPLHDAQTEQQLFDQLSELAKTIKAEGKAVVSLTYKQQTHNTAIDKKQWDGALSPFIKQLISAPKHANALQTYLSVNGFNGLPDMALALIDDVVELPADVLQMQLDQQQGLSYCSELSVRSDGPSNAKQQKTALVDQALNTKKRQDISADDDTRKTGNTEVYLLQGGLAIPLIRAEILLKNNQLSLQQSVNSNVHQMLQSNSVFIIGDTSRHELRINDRLGSNLADGVIAVIHVAAL